MKDVISAYCSWCFSKTKHDLHEGHWIGKNQYKCRKCENFTVECSMCGEMAKGPLNEK